MNLSRVLEAPARQDPERRALALRDRTVTYGELDRAQLRMARTLRENGVAPGTRVPLLDDCSPLAIATVLGAARIGAAAAPMHPQLTARELQDLVKTAGCGATGVAGDAHAPKLADALGRDVLSESALESGARDESPVPSSDDDEAEALVIFTSGTTGLPKPVPMREGVLAPRVFQFAGAFSAERPANISMTCVPVVHIGGLVGVLVALAGGSTVVVQPRFDAGEWLELVERHRVAQVFLVPAMLRRILDHPEFTTRDPSSLRLISYGAAPAPPDLIARAVAAFPGTAFSNVFGQTETLGAITALGPDDHRLDENGALVRAGSVGRPMPGIEIRIVDESENDVAPGEQGELWVRSPSNAEPGWRHTGDLVRQDADGYLYPAGRLSDTINRGGEKFGPSEIEDVLRRHPAVTDASVAGVPDPELGERVGAAVVLASPVDAASLGAFCREHLARYKVPERIAFLDEIPYTPLGKVNRKALAEIIVRHVEP